MATIYSNDNGQVVQATDADGAYYYVADSLGQPTAGAWDKADDAIAWLEAGDDAAPDPKVDRAMDDKGNRLCRCLCCNAEVPVAAPPDEGDDGAWGSLADLHNEDCQWLQTRAHRLDVSARVAEVGGKIGRSIARDALASKAAGEIDQADLARWDGLNGEDGDQIPADLRGQLYAIEAAAKRAYRDAIKGDE